MNETGSIAGMLPARVVLRIRPQVPVMLKDNASPKAGALYAALDMPFAGLVGQLAGAFAKGRPPELAAPGTTRLRQATEERDESFRHSRMGQDCVTQCGKWQPSNHRNLDRRHNFSRVRAESAESENAVARGVDECFHKPSCVGEGSGSQNALSGILARR